MAIREIFVDPKDIVKMSPISGSANSRQRKADKINCFWKNDFLYGTWDLTKRTLDESLTPKDYNLFASGKKSVYDWQTLKDRIINEGYVQDPLKRYVEVAMGRNGELLLVDGRHRLYLAQQLNIPEIPVNILDIHPEYNFDNLSLIKNPVVPEFLYNMISAKWDSEIKVYHHWLTIVHRHNLVKEYLPLLKGLNVLEVGANTGLVMWSIMKHASTLIELEVQEKYFKQCEITKECLKSKTDNFVFVQNTSFKNFENSYPFPINAFYASFVLYHMSDEEIEILKNEVLPKCKVVIIPNRNKERGKQKNSHHLNRPEEVSKLLTNAGFKTEIKMSDEGYSTIIGTR